ncbi:MAG TPA: SMC-Scp complex subunit ScpB [Candidatus Binataceae bacterium]|nr:SMC-Scp complex subunit ScpB [Candidatus Binataceae bacterium]
MEEERLKSILESLLFAAGEPVSLAKLTAIFENVPRATIQKTLATMATECAANNRGVTIDEVAGGYQMRTPKEHSSWVRKLLAAKPPRLSRPLLETLAIIAYRQPITRPEIEQLRGVDAGGVLETLLEKRLVKIAGRKEAPGRPIVYATTPEFLELFGLKDLDSLPDLSEFREIERAVEQAETKPIESLEKMPEDVPAETDMPAEPELEAEAEAEAEEIVQTDEAVELVDEPDERDEPKSES